jgi:hypothetical protein
MWLLDLTEIVANMKAKDDQMASLQKNIEERESNGRLQLQQARQRTQEVLNELESLRSALVRKTAECDAQKSALDAANFTASTTLVCSSICNTL